MRVLGREIRVRFSHATVLGRTIRMTQTSALPQEDDPLYRAHPRPTDLREKEWLDVRPYFPDNMMYAKNRRTPIRLLMNAVMFRLENNLHLRDVARYAPDFPPWGSLHAFENQIKNRGLWPEIIAKTGRDHLLPRLEKLMHLTPRVGAIPMSLSGEVRVLGRVIRMAAPPEVTDPVIKFEHPGYVHLPEHLEERRGNLASSSTDRRHASLDVIREAVQGKGLAFHAHTLRDDEDSFFPSRHDVILVGDRDGNVTAHHTGLFSNQRNRPESNIFHAPGVAVRDASTVHNESKYKWPPGGNKGQGKILAAMKADAEANRDLLKQHHEDAVASGKLFAKASFKKISDSHIDPRNFLAGTKPQTHPDHDASHELIMADALDESGYSGSARGLRKRHQEVLPAVDHSKWDQPGNGIHRAANYPDSFEMLARHERTPEEHETKGRRDIYDNPDLVAPQVPFYINGNSPPGKIGWRLSHESDHDKACLQVNAPPAVAAQVLALASQIPEDDLLDDDCENRIRCPHVTVKYGLDDDCGCLSGFVASHPGPVVYLGKLNVFKQDDEDVLYVEITSDGLKALRGVLDGEYGRDEKYPTYVPNMTVACLKPGRGDKYVGKDALVGLCFQGVEATFSPSTKSGQEDTFLAFGERPTVGVPVTMSLTKILGRVIRFAQDAPTPKEPAEFRAVFLPRDPVKKSDRLVNLIAKARSKL